jgi:ferredoxin
MKVRIDERCAGYGNCAVHLPEVFRLDEWGDAYVEGDGTVPDGMTERATRAILDCPMHAIHEIERDTVESD